MDFRNFEIQSQVKEQEGRFEYYSGMLQESETRLQEELERLKEVTSYQRFLSAVTPRQSLIDLSLAVGSYRNGRVSGQQL